MAQIGLLKSIWGFSVFCDFAQAIGVSESPQEISIRLHGASIDLSQALETLG